MSADGDRIRRLLRYLETAAMSLGGGPFDDAHAKRKMEKFGAKADVSRAAREAGYVSIPRRFWRRLRHRRGEPAGGQNSPGSDQG